VAALRQQQEADAAKLLGRRREWAADGAVLLYRCEVDTAGALAFVNLDPDSVLGSEGMRICVGVGRHSSRRASIVKATIE
jgi:hypothetical protein